MKPAEKTAPPYIIRPPTPEEVAASPDLTAAYDKAREILANAKPTLIDRAQANREAFAISIIAAVVHSRVPVFSLTEQTFRIWPTLEKNISVTYAGKSNEYQSTRSHVLAILTRWGIIGDVDQSFTAHPDFISHKQSALKLFTLKTNELLTTIGHDEISRNRFLLDECVPLTRASHARLQARFVKGTKRPKKGAKNV